MQILDQLFNLDPLEIAQTTVIVPDRSNSYNLGFVRNYITDCLKSKGQRAAFLPQIRSLFDIAREISGNASGSEIREADFSVLLIKDSTGKIPQRFSKPENRGYRKHLLKMLDLLSLENDDFLSLPAESVLELSKIGLDSVAVSYIYTMIRAKGYHFLGEIYQTAIAKTTVDISLLAGKKYLLVPGGFYSGREKKVLNLFGFTDDQITEIPASQEWKSFTEVLIKGHKTELNLDKIAYLKATKSSEMAEQIIFDISARMEGNSSLTLSDFTVICQTGESLSRIAATFAAYKIPFAAPLQNPVENSLALALQALKLGCNGNIAELTTFFNLYCEHFAAIELDLKSAGEEMSGADLEKVFDKQNRDKFIVDFVKNEEQLRVDLGRFQDFLRLVKIQNNSQVQPLKTVFDMLASKVNGLIKLFSTKDESNIYGFQPAIEKLFGSDLSISELLNYLTEIAGGSSQPHEQNFDGVNIVTVKDCLHAGKICYLTDLEEAKFLRWNEYNRILDRDKYDELEVRIFSRTKEQFIVDAFNSIWQQVEKVVFVLPVYGEESIITTKFDHLLDCYPHQQLTVTDGMQEFGEFSFGYDLKDLIREKQINSTIKTTEKQLQPISNNLTFTYSVEELKTALKSASNLEKFMLCPANFVAALKSEYNEINSTESFIAGQYFHDIVQDFLEFFRGKNLLCGDGFQRVKDSLVKETNKNGFIDSKVEQLVSLYLYNLSPKTPEEAFADLIFIFDTFELKKKLTERIAQEPDKTKVYGMEKDNQKIVGFLARLLCEIGPSPQTVTNSFLIELQFGNFTILPGVTIKSGYMDLVIIDADGKIRLFDLKSANIADYSEEMKKFQIVQLQIYREVLSNAIREQNFYCFDSVDEPKDGRKFSRLPQIYRNHQQPEAIAAYLSYKATFKAELDPDFAGFSEKLSDLLKQNIFLPTANHSCKYCNLQGGCDQFAPSCIKLDDFEGRGFKNSDKAFATFPKINYDAKQSEDKPAEKIKKTKNIVQFAPDSNQEKAVTSVRENIVISAGAGAGKTEVLSAKYINLLLNDDVEVQNIVCITFTNKAVGEMQKRIYNRLNDCLNTGSFFSVAKNSPSAYRLTTDQIEKLKRSKANFFKRNRISTFHAFCKQLLDRYGSLVFAEFDLENSLAPEYVLKDSLKKIVKAKHRDNYQDYLTANLISEEIETFQQWLKGQQFYYESGFGSSGGLLGELISLITKINLSPMGFDSINPEITAFNQRKVEIISILKEQFEVVKKEIISLINHGLTILPENDGRILRLQTAVLQVEAECVKPFDGNAYKKNAKDSDEIVEFRNSLAALKDKYEDSLYLATKNADDADESVIHKALYYICVGLYADLEKYKQQQGIIEQNDFHLRLIKLLEKDSALLQLLQKEFRYFLLDEFQDTNWLQDRLINLLFKQNENYLFIVGDLKQSIYRFQQCDNNIFMKYIRAGHKFLPFTHNYRSEPEIIDFNNWFFSENLNSNYNIFKTTARNPELPEFAKAGKKGKNSAQICFTEIYSQVQIGKDSDNDLSQADINQIVKIKEAEYICRTIQENSACGYDSFGILIRSYTKINYLLEMLKKYNIPFGFTMKKGLFSLPECQEFLKMVKVIFGLVNISEIEYIPQIKSLPEDILLEGSLQLYPVALRLLKHPGLQDYLARDIEFGSRIDNLNALLELIAEADSLFDNTAEKFYHLDSLADADSSGMETTASAAVKIMTVHSSKGLEFDNLFLINVGERDNADKSYISFVNKSYPDKNQSNFVEFSAKGFKGLVKDDEKKYWFAEYLKTLNGQLDEAESANLLYVALTRAKKNIFVTMLKLSEKDADGSEVNWLKNIEGNLFADMNKPEIELDFMGHSFKVQRKKICITELHEENGCSAGTINIPAKPQFPQFKVREKRTATNSSNEEGSAALDLGNLVHKFMEENLPACFQDGFNPKNILDKLDNNQEMSNKAGEIVQQLIDCTQFKEMVASADHIIKEQSLLLLSNDKTTYGMADLLIFKDNKIVIVDYKTFSGEIKDELLEKYKNQLAVYQEALAKIFTDKEISTFLLFASRKESKMIKI